MKRIYHWITSWFATAGAVRSVMALHRRCDALDRERLRVEPLLEREGERAAVANTRLQAALTTAQQTISRYEETVAELRGKGKVMELEIENLIAAHKKFLERYKAETAIEISRYTLPREDSYNR